jgi:tetratricopeptide (TPR) repeat protein
MGLIWKDYNSGNPKNHKAIMNESNKAHNQTLLEQMKKCSNEENYLDAKKIAEFLFSSNPDDIPIKFNLAIIYFYLGEYDKARELFESQRNDCQFREDAAKKERYVGSLFYTRSKYLHEVIDKYLLEKNLPEDFQKALSFYSCCTYYMANNFDAVSKQLEVSKDFFVGKKHAESIIWAVRFNELFEALIKFYKSNRSIYEKQGGKQTLYVIGESHALPLANLNIKIDGVNYHIKSEVITGVKIWHLISKQNNNAKTQFAFQLSRIPNGSKVIFTFGEIDARIYEGIIRFYQKNQHINIYDHIKFMATDYINFLLRHTTEKKLDIFVQGIPAPAFSNIIAAQTKEVQLFHQHIIKILNEELKAACGRNNIKFLDVYKLTVNDNGTSNNLYHIDCYHLSPHYIYQLL